MNYFLLQTEFSSTAAPSKPFGRFSQRRFRNPTERIPQRIAKNSKTFTTEAARKKRRNVDL